MMQRAEGYEKGEKSHDAFMEFCIIKLIRYPKKRAILQFCLFKPIVNLFTNKSSWNIYSYTIIVYTFKCNMWTQKSRPF